LALQAIESAQLWYEANKRILRHPLYLSMTAHLGDIKTTLIGQDDSPSNLLLGGDTFVEHEAEAGWQIWVHAQLLDFLEGKLTTSFSQNGDLFPLPNDYIEALLALPERKRQLPTRYSTLYL